MEEAPGARVIVVVDDDEDFCVTLADLLSDYGYHVCYFTDSEAALRSLQTQPLPSVLLLDWVMPNMAGPQFVAALQQDPRLRRLRVVVVTGLPHVILPATAGYPILPKPFDMDELLCLLRPEAAK
jgi:CheY-like chemotaxis protein